MTSLILSVCALPVHAQTRVDLELVLMVDVSRSMSFRELEIQRVGYIEAMGTDEVLSAIQSGPEGRIAVTFVEWAGDQRVVVPWSILSSRDDLDAFTLALETSTSPAYRRTSISGALHFGAGLFDNGIDAPRQVIDLSGDGPNNLGSPVDLARDDVVGQGIVINGLPLMTREGMGSQMQIDNLDAYFADCVIGGDGAFVLPVYDWDDFGQAVARKMVREIVVGEEEQLSGPERIIPAQFLLEQSVDCQVGEKMWRERNWDLR